MKRSNEIYATEKQRAYIQRLLNECFYKRIDTGYPIDMSRNILKSVASQEIERLLGLIEKDKTTKSSEITLKRETTLYSAYQGDGQEAQKLVLPAGAKVGYEVTETPTGSYHKVRTEKDGLTFESACIASSMHEVAKQLKVGDVIEVGNRTHHPNHRGARQAEAVIEIRSRRISNLETREDGTISITYVPCSLPNSEQCGFGCFHVQADSPKPYCAQWIAIIGHEEPRPRAIWNPRPGDTAYDLMC